jgi:hypothetical protein
MADNQGSMEQRFEESVFPYMNGTLDESGRKWVEHYLREHAQARRDLAYYQQLKQGLHESVEQLPAEVGWARVMQRVRNDGQPVASGIKQWLANALRSITTSPAFAAASVLVVIQGAVIAGLLVHRPSEVALQEPSVAMTRSLVSSNYAAPLLRVKFKANAKLQDIGTLLADLDGSIVEGPGQGGYYLIICASGQLVGAAEKLRLSNLADEVVLIPASPKQR